MKFDAVIFDLDNTLYSYDRAHAVAFAAVKDLAWERLSLAPEDFEARHRQANAILTERCGGGPAIHNRLIRYQILLEQAGLPMDRALRLAKCYWERFLQAMEPEPGAAETLGKLRAWGLRVGIGTNMSAALQFEKLRLLGLLPLVDFIVTSEELGVEKPDKRLFLLCAEKAGCPPERCAFVGDSLVKDAQAARDAGMQGIWLCPGGEGQGPEGILTLSALEELPALLQGAERRIKP